MSESDKCTLYKQAVIGPTENKKTSAGICPKVDTLRPWQFEGSEPIYPPEIFQGKQLWCGKASGSICTFPFFLYGVLFYEPYIDILGVPRCGTFDNALVPINYASDYDLEEAVLCIGKRINIVYFVTLALSTYADVDVFLF